MQASQPQMSSDKALPPPPPYPGYSDFQHQMEPTYPPAAVLKTDNRNFVNSGEPQQQRPPHVAVVVKADNSGYVNPACASGEAAADYDIAEAGAAGFTMRGLDDREIRRGFIRKVYLILTAQLLVTFVTVIIFSTVAPVKNFARSNLWLFHLSYAVFFITYLAIVCVTPLRRKFPGNFIALTIFTCSLSFMTGVIASCYQTNSVAVCLAITAGVCLCVTLFAVQTKVDFTMCSGLLFGLSVVVFFFGLSCAITFAVYRGNPNAAMGLRILDCVYGGLLALVFVLFLVFDTQRVVGGRRHNLSEEEYVFGAMQIYVDVVYIFIILLGFSRQ